MSVAVRWPNPVSPGLSSFRVEAPASWSVVEPPGALMALLSPEVNGFRANLVVFGERLPQEISLSEVAEGVLREASAKMIVEPLGIEPSVGAGGRPIVVREATACVEGHDIRQLVVATEAADWSPGGLRSVFVLLGTHLVGRTATDERVLVDVIASFILGDNPA
jgi:hypothetical protein